MLDLMEKGRKKLKRTMDLTSLNEDIGILSDMVKLAKKKIEY